MSEWYIWANDEANELLRSAYAVCLRHGESTNWEALKNSIEKELLKRAGVPENLDQQILLRATCTPRTYRIHESQYDS